MSFFIDKVAKVFTGDFDYYFLPFIIGYMLMIILHKSRILPDSLPG
jgi:hypothetical protein